MRFVVRSGGVHRDGAECAGGIRDKAEGFHGWDRWRGPTVRRSPGQGGLGPGYLNSEMVMYIGFWQQCQNFCSQAVWHTYGHGALLWEQAIGEHGHRMMIFCTKALEELWKAWLSLAWREEETGSGDRYFIFACHYPNMCALVLAPPAGYYTKIDPLSGSGGQHCTQTVDPSLFLPVPGTFKQVQHAIAGTAQCAWLMDHARLLRKGLGTKSKQVQHASAVLRGAQALPRWWLSKENS